MLRMEFFATVHITQITDDFSPITSHSIKWDFAACESRWGECQMGGTLSHGRCRAEGMLAPQRH